MHFLKEISSLFLLFFLRVKLSCEQPHLLEALNIVQKAINSQSTLPILGNVLLKAEGQKLHLVGTNLEIAISTSFSAEIQNEGSITIPAKILVNYINFLKEGKIELSLDGGDTLLLKAEGVNTKLKGLPPEEFPVIPVVEKEEAFTLSAEVLKKAIDETVFCASSSSTRPVLSGIYLWGKEGTIKIVATDSYRLGEKTIPLEKKKFETELKQIIPARTMQELSRILTAAKKGKEVEVICSKNQILFKFDGTELISRLIEGTFPEYAKIIPDEAKTKIQAPVEELILGIKRVGIFARENNNNIKFKFVSGKIHITTEATEVGNEESEIPAKTKGPENEIALNGQYFLDILQNLEEEEVNLEVEEKLAPVMIRPTKEKGLIHVIMPLKV